MLDDELARLPEKYRAPLVECFYREKTQDEAAKALGWSLSTLRRRLEAGKGLLRSRLTRRGATVAGVLAAGALAQTATAAVPPALAAAATGTAVAAVTTGAVPGAIFTLANGGMGMSANTNWVTAAVIGVAIIGTGVPTVLLYGYLTPPPAQQNLAPPNPARAEEPKPTEPPKPADPATPERAPAPAPAPAPPAGDWVTIKGRVVWPDGVPLPSAKKIDVTTDKEHCLTKGDLAFEDVVVSPKTRGVKNVIVWLRPDSPDRKVPFPPDRVHPELARARPAHHVIDQPCCQFVPRVVAARAGDTLEVKNSAPVAHNVNINADDPALTVNLTLPSKASQKFGPLAAQATPIPFKCDIHPWMAGRMRVFDHPYFAVTDDDGNFEIKLAPHGSWRVVYWHENGFHKGREGVLGFPVEVTKGKHLELPAVGLELPK